MHSFQWHFSDNFIKKPFDDIKFYNIKRNVRKYCLFKQSRAGCKHPQQNSGCPIEFQSYSIGSFSKLYSCSAIGSHNWTTHRRDFFRSIDFMQIDFYRISDINIFEHFMHALKSFIQLTAHHIVGVRPIFGGPMCLTIWYDIICEAWFCLHTHSINCRLVFTGRWVTCAHSLHISISSSIRCAYSIRKDANNKFSSVVGRQNRHINEIKSIRKDKMKAVNATSTTHLKSTQRECDMTICMIDCNGIFARPSPIQRNVNIFINFSNLFSITKTESTMTMRINNMYKWNGVLRLCVCVCHSLWFLLSIVVRFGWIGMRAHTHTHSFSGIWNWSFCDLFIFLHAQASTTHEFGTWWNCRIDWNLSLCQIFSFRLRPILSLHFNYVLFIHLFDQCVSPSVFCTESLASWINSLQNCVEGEHPFQSNIGFLVIELGEITAIRC